VQTGTITKSQNAVASSSGAFALLHDRISHLISSIYEAPYDQTKWAVMADRLREELDCRALLISAVYAANQTLSSTAWYGLHDGKSARAIEEYSQDFYRFDPTIAYAAQHPLARFCDSSDLAAPEQPYHDIFMRWYRDRFKSPSFIVGYAPPHDGLTLGVSAHPGFANQAFDFELFTLLFSHVSRSVALAARPPDIPGDNEAVILVRSSGKIVALSKLAEAYLAQQDGLRYECGVLRAASPSVDASIAHAIRSASFPSCTGDAGAPLFVKRPSARRAWALSVSPFPSLPTPLAAFQAQAVIKIVDPSRQRSVPEQVSASLGFTQREHQIAELLLNGHSPSSVATFLDISENTVKVHLQALFRKTQTTRQVELIKLLADLS
jgi:DNA-binding CsgD family transcriptional regulator